jgi:PEP-CTERM motif
MKNPKSKILVAAIVACLARTVASAALIQINDATETLSTTYSGFSTGNFGSNAGSLDIQEGIGSLGESHSVFTYNNAFLATQVGIGGTLQLNFNIFEGTPLTSALSDTMFISFQHTSGTLFSVHGHFLSESSDETTLPTALTAINGPVYNISETGSFANISTDLGNGVISLAPALSVAGITDLDVQFQSVPEPGTIGFGLALLGTFFARRRRGAKQSA